MGVGLFPGLATRTFFQNFYKGPKSGETNFYPWKQKKTFLLNFQMPIGGQGVVAPSSNAHDFNRNPYPNSDADLMLSPKINP